MTGQLRQTVSRTLPFAAATASIWSSVNRVDESTGVEQRRFGIKQTRSPRQVRWASSEHFHFGNVSYCDAFDSSLRTGQTIMPYDGRNFIADAVERVMPAVVKVEVSAKDLSDNADTPALRGSGSGFMVKTDDILPPHLYLQSSKDLEEASKWNQNGPRPTSRIMVVTNAHCVLTPAEFRLSREDASFQKDVYLELPDGRLLSGTIVAFDTALDVAMIEPKAMEDTSSSEGPRPNSPSSSSSSGTHTLTPTASLLLPDQYVSKHTGPRYGEFVMAIGAPLQLDNTVTVGVVSNPRRRCHHGQKTYIQSDVSLHVGNSGGPLINVDGQVIGINSKKVATGIAYSIPIDIAVEGLQEAYFKQNNYVAPPKMNDTMSSSPAPSTRQFSQSTSSENSPTRQADQSDKEGRYDEYASLHTPLLISRRW